MYEIILEVLEKHSYTNEDGENVIPLNTFEEIIEEICKGIDDNF